MSDQAPRKSTPVDWAVFFALIATACLAAAAWIDGYGPVGALTVVGTAAAVGALAAIFVRIAAWCEEPLR